ncbi:MAG: NHL repeat-containing protein, partial [Candidatus Acidiferrales bacterium]
YLSAWGAKGNGPGQFDDPVSIATDGVGNVFAADAGSGFIQKFSPDGVPLLAFQEYGMDHPQWITLDSGGAIYAADPASNAFFVFLPDGDRYREVRLRSARTRENTLSVAVGADGVVHVLDSNAARVYVYTSRFRLARIWKPEGLVPGGAQHPLTIEMGPDGSLYIAEPANNRIERFASDGRLLNQIHGSGGAAGSRISSEFAVSADALFDMDPNGRMLHVFTPDGNFKFDRDLAPELGQANRPPPPLAVSVHHELLVLDAPESRVLRYRINF